MGAQFSLPSCPSYVQFQVAGFLFLGSSVCQPLALLPQALAQAELLHLTFAPPHTVSAEFSLALCWRETLSEQVSKPPLMEAELALRI